MFMKDSLTFDLQNPAQCKQLQEILGNRTLDAAYKKLGEGFSTLPDRTFDAIGDWRAMYCPIVHLGNFDLLIQKFIEDIIVTGHKRFMRLRSEAGLFSIVEKHGFCIRVFIDIYCAEPKVIVDYVGIK